MFHALSERQALDTLRTTQSGLSSREAAVRLTTYGPNELQQQHRETPLKIFLSQFKSPIVWILVGAIIISILEKELIDAVVISVILFANAILGFVQEYKAEKAIEALQKLAALHAKVFRSGKLVSIDAHDLVPGDIIRLEEGDKVPADIRLLEVVEFHTQEASLTGESVPVGKHLNVLPDGTPLADQKNMAFAGTIISKGHAVGVVCRTGMSTEIGKIAHLIQEPDTDQTPLQKKLKKLGAFLAVGTLVICAVIFLTGVLKGKDPSTFLLVAVALAVAAIPEGLPAIVTISLALGVQRLLKRNALLRKLPSGETLGCTTVICTDKTGTLTHNEMTVKKVWVDGKVITVSGSGYGTAGTFSAATPTLARLLVIGALNNDARLTARGVIGDPTEAALLVSALKNRLDYQILNVKHKRISEIPFSSERKRMTTIHHIEGASIAYVKGAVDVLLSLCTSVEINGRQVPLTAAMKDKILQQNEAFAAEALRVLGFAYKQLKQNEAGDAVERSLVFVGMQAMIDPPREEVRGAIATCHRAGIRVIMITGDHKTTALAIAGEIGIRGKAVSGDEIAGIDLSKEVDHIAVYARVNPQHKLLIVDALKKKGNVVAMTGDGVNDAPALKKADIGIAMGIAGTDVTKEAADIILLDDNFTSIVSAVEEGRGIYDNIQKSVAYLLSSNIGEVFTLFFAIMIGLPLPLAAIMILWMNLVTDGLPAIALGVEPAEKDIMERPPRKPKSDIITIGSGAYLLCLGVLMAAGTLGVFAWSIGLDGVTIGSAPQDGPVYAYATTMAFTTIVLFQLFNVLNNRSDHQSIFKIGLLSNKKLAAAVLASFALQLVVLYGPLQQVFGTVSLSFNDWLVVLLVSSSVLWLGEIVKLLKRIKLKGRRYDVSEFVVPVMPLQQ